MQLNPMRLTATFLLPALLCCGQPLWHPPLPSLATDPLPGDRPIAWGIYATLLAPEGGPTDNHPVRHSVFLAESTLAVGHGGLQELDFDVGGRGFIQSRWPDSIKVGFSAAFADFWTQTLRRRPLDPAALAGLPVHLGVPTHPTCASGAPPQCQEEGIHIALSPIGFNGDSTFAVAYRSTWCGPLCGTGAVFLFRRLPGRRWTLWSVYGLWIS
jgi:hypothetical protein